MHFIGRRRAFRAVLWAVLAGDALCHKDSSRPKKSIWPFSMGWFKHTAPEEPHSSTPEARRSIQDMYEDVSFGCLIIGSVIIGYYIGRSLERVWLFIIRIGRTIHSTYAGATSSTLSNRKTEYVHPQIDTTKDTDRD